MKCVRNSARSHSHCEICPCCVPKTLSPREMDIIRSRLRPGARSGTRGLVFTTVSKIIEMLLDCSMSRREIGVDGTTVTVRCMPQVQWMLVIFDSWCSWPFFMRHANTQRRGGVAHISAEGAETMQVSSEGGIVLFIRTTAIAAAMRAALMLLKSLLEDR